MEVPGLAHNITSPLSPCEGMIKDLSLDAIQLCERDGKESFRSAVSAYQCGVETFARIFGALGPIVNFQIRCNAYSVFCNWF